MAVEQAQENQMFSCYMELFIDGTRIPDLSRSSLEEPSQNLKTKSFQEVEKFTRNSVRRLIAAIKSGHSHVLINLVVAKSTRER